MKQTTLKVTSSEESLCRNQTLAYLNKWRIGGLNVDVPRLFKTTFQELLLISVLATLAVLADLLYNSSHDNQKGECMCSIAVPLAFFVTLIIAKVYETKLLQQVCAFTGLGYTGSNARYRVVQKIIILAVVLTINFAPVLITDSVQKKTFHISDLGLGRKSKFSKISTAILRTWQFYSTKLFGAYVVVTFCRLYIDLGIYSYRLLSYVPSDDEDYELKKLGKPDQREEEMSINDNNANTTIPPKQGSTNHRYLHQ